MVISEIKPGKTTADAAKHFPPATKWGYKSEVEILASEIGHGIGLGTNTGYDIPIINRLWSFDHPQVFEEGMTLAVESREGETRVGGASLENMLVVTKNGAEIMDYFPRDEILDGAAMNVRRRSRFSRITLPPARWRTTASISKDHAEAGVVCFCTDYRDCHITSLPRF